MYDRGFERRLIRFAGSLASMAFSLFILFGFTGCGASTERTVPDELDGFWETDEKQYEDCVLEMRGGLIVFQKGPSFTDINYVKKIAKDSLGNKILYQITYKNKDNDDSNLSFYYSKDPDGEVLRLKNREYIEWRRKKSDLIFFP